MYHIASVSWGKDSLAMLLKLIEKNYPLNEVVFYNTGMEFQAVYDMRDHALPLLQKHGVLYTELHPGRDFFYLMVEKSVTGKKGIHYGYSWCGGWCRWGTTEKLRTLDRYAKRKNAIVYVAIAADETKRLEKGVAPYKRLPLVSMGITEEQALAICYENSFEWRENGYRLYDLLDRVSCWCCSNKNLKELENICHFLPYYWAQLRYIQERTDRPMKGPGKSVFELEKRFALKAAA